MCDCCKPKPTSPAVAGAASPREGGCEKGKDPETCSPEQIKECHGEAREHECVAAEGSK
jgi:hypothetical protein